MSKNESIMILSLWYYNKCNNISKILCYHQKNKFIVNVSYYCNINIDDISITSNLITYFIYRNNQLFILCLLFLYTNYNFLGNNLIIIYLKMFIYSYFWMRCFIPQWSRPVFSSSLHLNAIRNNVFSVVRRQWVGLAS